MGAEHFVTLCHREGCLDIAKSVLQHADENNIGAVALDYDGPGRHRTITTNLVGTPLFSRHQYILVSDIQKALDFACWDASVLLGDPLLQQEKGLPMESSCSPILAGLQLDHGHRQFATDPYAFAQNHAVQQQPWQAHQLAGGQFHVAAENADIDVELSTRKLRCATALRVLQHKTAWTKWVVQNQLQLIL